MIPTPLDGTPQEYGFLALSGAPPSLNNIFATSKKGSRSEEHTSELQSQPNLVCRLLLEKKNIDIRTLETGDLMMQGDNDYLFEQLHVLHRLTPIVPHPFKIQDRPAIPPIRLHDISALCH